MKNQVKKLKVNASLQMVVFKPHIKTKDAIFLTELQALYQLGKHLVCHLASRASVMLPRLRRACLVLLFANSTHLSVCYFCLSQGRAIRHKHDYASILLLDRRYSDARVHHKLPDWIRRRLLHHRRFGVAFAAVRKVSRESGSSLSN